MSQRSASPSLHTLATSFGCVESPQTRRCFPSLYTSPGVDTGTSGVSGTASGSVSPCVPASPPRRSSSSSSPNARSERSNPASCRAETSIFSFSSSHSAISATLLSAMRSACSCSGVRSVAMMHGIVSQPSFFTARSRVWPSMMTLSLLRTAGFLNPSCSMIRAS